METPEAARSGPKWVDSMTLGFPRELPMQYEFEEPRFYVRACYPQYYNLITRMLNSKRAKVVTVTGNPGIGKSLFYAYFLLRFRAENEATSIITISFAKQNNASVMRKVVVWKGDRVVAATSKPLAMASLIEKAEEEAKSNVIHLYNGSPEIAAASARAVCFTSPDKLWFDHIKKSQYRPKLFMPLWDLRELQTAAKALHLSVLGGDEGPKALYQDEVEVRFITFGGIARECLSSDQDFVYERQQDIEKMVGQFNDAGSARRLLQDLESEMVMYAPHPDNPRRYELAEPPHFVKRLLVAKLSTMDPSTLDEIMGSFRVCTLDNSFRSVLFEVEAHKILSSEWAFTARLLGDGNPPTYRAFECAKSTLRQRDAPFCYFDGDLSPTDLQYGPYQVPWATNFVAIDSFYCAWFPPRDDFGREAQLWLFQITTALTHSVSGRGVAFVLDRLGFMTKANQQPQRVALVFVVPSDVAEQFERQEIEVELSSEEGDLCNVNGIDDTQEKALKAAGIYTVRDLRNVLEGVETLGADALSELLDSFEFLRELLHKHDETQQQRKWLTDTLNVIPQYLWGFGSCL